MRRDLAGGVQPDELEAAPVLIARPIIVAFAPAARAAMMSWPWRMPSSMCRISPVTKTARCW
jgi:hypothetical protein